MATVQIRPLATQLDDFERLMAVGNLQTRNELYQNAIELLIFYGQEVAQKHFVCIKDLGLQELMEITIDDLWKRSKITVTSESRVADTFELPREYLALLSDLTDRVPDLATPSLGDMFLLGTGLIERILADAAYDRQIITCHPETETYLQLVTPFLEHKIRTTTTIN